MDAQKVMTLKECRLHIHEALSKIYPKTEIDSFFFLMIEEKLNLQRIDTVLKPDLLISQDNLTTFLKIIKRLQNEEERDLVGGTMETMKMATRKEEDKLTSPHTFADGSQDMPLLKPRGEDE